MNVWFWWAAYTVCSIWAQECFAGIDFFSAGLIVCLQAGQWRRAVWLALFWGLLQEGTGTLAFGAILLFDVGLFCLFFAGKWLLEPENPLFVIVVSALLVVWHEVVVVGLASLQDFMLPWSPFSVHAVQFAAYVLTWAFVYPLFSKVVPRVAN